MRKLAMLAAAALAATTMSTAPAWADVTPVAASSVQGTLVHGTGTSQTGTTVTGNLGAGGPNIVNFDGTTTDPNGGNELLLQGGQGQADVTGAEITLGGPGNDLYSIISGNIYLTGYQGMQSIEFGLTSGVSGTIDFVVSALGADGVTPETFNYTMDIGEGDTFFAFLASGGEAITNVFYSVGSPPDSITLVKQVRIDLANGTPAVPEPATWAMMLMGFGATGVAMRRSRRRKGLLTQIA